MSDREVRGFANRRPDDAVRALIDEGIIETGFNPWTEFVEDVFRGEGE